MNSSSNNNNNNNNKKNLTDKLIEIEQFEENRDFPAHNNGSIPKNLSAYIFKATQLNCNFHFFLLLLPEKDFPSTYFYSCEIKMKIESEILHFLQLFSCISFYYLFLLC